MTLTTGNKNLHQKKSLNFQTLRCWIKKDEEERQKWMVRLQILSERFGDCGFPCRLSAGSVQSILGKLFEAYGRIKQWDPKSGSGNPVRSLQIPKYVKAIKKKLNLMLGLNKQGQFSLGS